MVTQCNGTTKNKERCGNKIRIGNYCHLHRNKEEIVVKKEIIKEEIVREIIKGKEEIVREIIKGKEEIVVKEEIGECCICYESTLDTLECKHIVCLSCLKQLEKPNCPLCRVEVKSKLITPEIRKEWERKLNLKMIDDLTSVRNSYIAILGNAEETTSLEIIISSLNRVNELTLQISRLQI